MFVVLQESEMVTFRKRGEGGRQKDVYKGQNQFVTDRSSLKTFLIC